MSTADTEVHYTNNKDGTSSTTVEMKKSPVKNRRTSDSIGDEGLPDDAEKQGGSSMRRNSRIPVLFHRVKSGLYNPKFDSKMLEKQHNLNYFSTTRQRFQYALIYIIIACIVWITYFSAMQMPNWYYFVIPSSVLLFVLLCLLLFTKTKIYPKYRLIASIVTPMLITGVCLSTFINTDNQQLSQVGLFNCVIAVLLLIYTLLSLPLYISVLVGIVISVSFEALWAFTAKVSMYFLAARVILHLCIHMVGIQNFLMSQARKRSTFLKVGESIVHGRSLEAEKENKMNMIQSLMPYSVAQDVMKMREAKDADDVLQQPSSNGKEKGQIKFRDFHMSKMDNVSIVFADIVGFTKMSSNKTAEHLVSLLNDLFGRFDELCTASGCEKISTLGDCYYCVSGCPKPREDHARCCIVMGMGMIEAIKQFDEEHNELVGMRIGVHTGTVLCGIVGTRRFKFDVWSHDVTLANQMESDGEPGKVHVSEPTYQLAKDFYEFREGESVPGKSYLEVYMTLIFSIWEDLNLLQTSLCI